MTADAKRPQSQGLSLNPLHNLCHANGKGRGLCHNVGRSYRKQRRQHLFGYRGILHLSTNHPNLQSLYELDLAKKEAGDALDRIVQRHRDKEMV